ncbi:MAG: quinoprotein dehydrogenase-associated SoxYZ-like carrier [Alphaproteobacteria bacterium]|nr:quinoprotein dehydrogenase-associated SoxYZ-like carrier [Alphaproteobacteria bacterium]
MLSGWRQALITGEAAFKAAAVVLLTAFMAFSTVPSSAWAEETRRDDVSPGFNHDAWNDIRGMLYEDQVIKDGKGVISLTAPYRAEDAAIVPITIAAAKPQTKGEFIESITLVIDQNPSPVAAVFHLTPDSGLATIDTRIRINAFTDIRAIAKMNDGRLFMATEFIKAAGGCSTPGLSEMDEAIARAGKMKMKFLASDMEGAGGQAQLLIRHPNFSGLQMDQISGDFIPAHYVDSIEVTRGGAKILGVEGDISLSEDPSIRFYFGDDTSGDISAVVTDTHGKTFSKSWPVSKLAKN